MAYIGYIGSQPASVNTADLFDLAVTTAKIRDANVTLAKIADGAVSGDKLDVDAVSTAKIVNQAVTGDKIANATITTAKFAAGAVTAALGSNAVFSGVTFFAGSAAEKANIVAQGAPTYITIDNQVAGIVYFAGNSVSNSNVTVNLNNLDYVNVGNTISYVLMITNNVDNQAYVNAVQINGAAGNTTRWLNTTPTEGLSANIDVYSFNVLKTGASSYVTLASYNSFN